jgi:hypothetical protein
MKHMDYVYHTFYALSCFARDYADSPVVKRYHHWLLPHQLILLQSCYPRHVLALVHPLYLISQFLLIGNLTKVSNGMWKHIIYQYNGKLFAMWARHNVFRTMPS